MGFITVNVFNDVLIKAGLKILKITKHERDCRIMKVLHKFSYDGRNFRIVETSEKIFYFESTKYNCRYYHFVKAFYSLKEAQNFIFTTESGDILP